MVARHVVLILALAIAVAGSCTNDFDQFQVGGDANPAPGSGGTATGGTGGSSAATSGTGGSTVLGGSAGTAGTRTGGGGVAGSGATATGGTSDGGMAGTPGCPPNQKDCDGTCSPLTEPRTGCTEPGVCDPCALDHATETCGSTGACAVGRCDAAWGDCDRDPASGCEHPLDADTAQCGACGRACSTTGVASAECSGGVCTSSCAAGHANCTHPATGADDGCETDSAADAANCGGCNNSCTAQGLVCSGSQCGCSNRGQCGNGSGVDCVGGACTCDAATCRPGEKCRQSGGSRLCSCNGGTQGCGPDEFCCQTPAGCVNVKTSTANCGACGHACTTGFVCVDGACACERDADCVTPGASGTGGAAGSGAGDGGAAGDSSGGPACVLGLCVCNSTTCGAGERCLADGRCG